MKEFFAKHSYLVVWITSLAIIGSLATLLFQLNSYYLPTQNQTVAPPAAPAPATPSITFTIETNGKDRTLLIQWQNLPEDTTALAIWRIGKNSSGTPQYWRAIQITADELANGTIGIDLGSDGNNYVYYAEAVGGGGGAGDNGSSTGDILWTSDPTTPIVSTSTESGPSDNGPTSENNNSSTPPENTTTTTPSSTPVDTIPGNDPSNNPTNPNPSSSGDSSSSNGNFYYNPEIQVTGTGSATGNFWMQRINQSIQIGWQDIPSGTDSIFVAHSENANGPWNQILAEQNPNANGSYSLGLVDGTVNSANYYTLTALSGTTTLATYGPVYLAPTE